MPRGRRERRAAITPALGWHAVGLARPFFWLRRCCLSSCCSAKARVPSCLGSHAAWRQKQGPGGKCQQLAYCCCCCRWQSPAAALTNASQGATRCGCEGVCHAKISLDAAFACPAAPGRVPSLSNTTPTLPGWGCASRRPVHAASCTSRVCMSCRAAPVAGWVGDGGGPEGPFCMPFYLSLSLFSL